MKQLFVAEVETYKPTRMDLFLLWRDKRYENDTKKRQHVQNVVVTRLRTNKFPEEHLTAVRQSVNVFCTQVSQKWKGCARNEKAFLKKYPAWLRADFLLPFPESDVNVPSSSKLGAGRPQIRFEESSERTKRRKTMELRAKHETKQLTYAAQMSLRSSGKEDAAKLMHEALHTTPSRASKIRKAWQQQRNKNAMVPYSAEEALSLFIETKMTKNQYQKIRSGAVAKGANIYPSYHKLRAAKKKCYPKQGSVKKNV